MQELLAEDAVEKEKGLTQKAKAKKAKAKGDLVAHLAACGSVFTVSRQLFGNQASAAECAAVHPDIHHYFQANCPCDQHKPVCKRDDICNCYAWNIATSSYFCLIFFCCAQTHEVRSGTEKLHVACTEADVLGSTTQDMLQARQKLLLSQLRQMKHCQHLLMLILKMQRPVYLHLSHLHTRHTKQMDIPGLSCCPKALLSLLLHLKSPRTSHQMACQLHNPVLILLTDMTPLQQCQSKTPCSLVLSHQFQVLVKPKQPQRLLYSIFRHQCLQVWHQVQCKARDQGQQPLRLTLCLKHPLPMYLRLSQTSHPGLYHPRYRTGHHRALLASKPSPSSCVQPSHPQESPQRRPTLTTHPKSRLPNPLLPQWGNS